MIPQTCQSYSHGGLREALQFLPANKWVLVHFGTAQGYPEGTYEVESFGLELRFIVQGDIILVDDPYQARI